MPDARRHHANRDVQVVFVEIPAAGSQKIAREVKPSKYPRDQRPPWRPQHDIPPRRQPKIVRFIDAINKQDQDIRAFMAEARRRAT